MKALMTISGIALLLFWALGFFMFGFSGLIHTALILSAILFLKCAMICPKREAIADQKINMPG